MQIFMKNPKFSEWCSVRPSEGTPYQYKTELEAYEMLRICYPLCIYGEEVRVIEIKSGKNYRS